ncbi:hypothetical protein [Rhizobium tubonense]|uniref:hypothetical protein n=1 Tax=Rhizobium tubonense TaxID=484088 RepID=UPI0011B4244D|nr:hypothetical protein [Rhizobium tubonense]
MAAGELPKRTHFDVLKANTGWALDRFTWVRRTWKSQRRTAQTERIASALTRAGINVYRDSDVTLISAITGVVEKPRSHRSVCILPDIAARERGAMVNGLKLFMTGHKNSKHFRYAVMTSRHPVPVGGDLRKSIQKLSRRISKWSHYIKKWDVKVLFRGIEFTRMTAEGRGMTDRYAPDTILYRVHANVIYWPTRKLKPAEWIEFLEQTKKFMDAEWQDSGTVEDVEQIVRYCTKPADTEAAPDEELVWLYRQTERLKICQPLGDFKIWMSEIKKRGEKIVRVHVGNGQGRLVRVQKSHRRNLVKLVDEPTDDERADTQLSGTPPEGERSTLPPARLLGMTRPQWRHSPWAEPLIIVQNYDPAVRDDDFEHQITGWRQEARRWWDAANAPTPEEALRVARVALAGCVPGDDECDPEADAEYILDLCRATVPEAFEADPTPSDPVRKDDALESKSEHFLNRAVEEVLFKGDESPRSIREVINEMAKRNRRVSPVSLPKVAEVQMCIWRRRRREENLKETWVATNLQIIQELLAAA